MSLTYLWQFALTMLIVFGLHVLWARQRIRQWAERNGFRILECRVCLVNLGPFSYFGTSGGQSVFRVTVLDPKGERRCGYARAGGYFFGLARKRVEVKWDKGPEHTLL